MESVNFHPVWKRLKQSIPRDNKDFKGGGGGEQPRNFSRTLPNRGVQILLNFCTTGADAPYVQVPFAASIHKALMLGAEFT